MKVPVLLAAFVLSSMLANAFAEEPIVMEQVTPNGQIKVQIEWPEVLPDDIYEFPVRFLDANTNKPIKNVIFAVLITQEDDVIEKYSGLSAPNGEALVEVMFGHTGSATVQVVVLTIIKGSTYAPMKEQVSFSVNVVPEFPLVVIVMVTSMTIILVLTKLDLTKRFLESIA